MTTVIDEVVGRETRHILQTYRRQAVTFVRGQGVRLWDAEGREYFDLLSGIGVAALGHSHRGLARAVAEQSETLIHTSNLFYHPLQGQLAERLANLSGLPRAFFCNSGTEAVEACLKFARRYWYTKGEPRSEVIALEESFHGRTFGSLSVTSDEHYRAPFAPLLAGVRFVPLDEPVGGGLLAHIGRVGQHFERRLKAIAAKHSIVKDVRGRGLMWGVELTRDAAPVVPAGLERGVVVNRTAETVVRLLPPLIISEADVDDGLDRLDAALGAVGAAP